MNTLNLDALLHEISFDKNCLEASFQFRLLMRLAKLFDESSIFPERNIAYYKLEKGDFPKERIDIVIEQKNNRNMAIELKMPMNGEVPEQMYKFCKDIHFLEKLRAAGMFCKCFFAAVTNDSRFWQGPKDDGLYPYFRGKPSAVLKGAISKPTGKGKGQQGFIITGSYPICWKELPNDFRYFVVEI